MGRVVRSLGDEDDSRAYVFVPVLKHLKIMHVELKARWNQFTWKRIYFQKQKNAHRVIKNVKLKLKNVIIVGLILRTNKKKKKKSSFCGFENEMNAEKCISCEKFWNWIYIVAKWSLKNGWYTDKGHNEDEVKDSEKHYENIRKEILESECKNDDIGLFPGRSLIKLKKF